MEDQVFILEVKASKNLVPISAELIITFNISVQTNLNKTNNIKSDNQHNCEKYSTITVWKRCIKIF